MVPKKVEVGERKEIRIGLLGCGFMGRCHTNAYKTMSDIFPESKLRPRLLILCDKNEEKARREAARFGYEEYSTDWREVVADERVDVFDNCGPDPVHPEPCIAALQNGKHVLCEKPMALSLADARRMRDAAAAAHGRAMSVFNYRFVPAVRFAKNLIDEGKLGTIYHFRVNYQQYYGHDPSFAPEQCWPSAWPHSGALQGIGTHAIDQCRFLVGDIKTVSALVHNFHPERALPTEGGKGAVSDEAAAAILEFQNGAIGVMETSVMAPGRKNCLSWEINASKGSLRWDLEHPNSLFACLTESSDSTLRGFTEISVTDPEHPFAGKWWGPGHNLGWEHAHVIEKHTYLEAIAHGRPLDPHTATFEDGYRVALVIDAMRRSTREGKKIEVRTD